MLLIGDVHGKFGALQSILDKNDDKQILQVGDLGVGFPSAMWPAKFDDNFRFIRGNHDNPYVSWQHPNYLGDWGITKNGQIGYISGAWSIDQQYRIKGRTYWEEEELSYRELNEAVDYIVEHKPSIIVTHECPQQIYEHVAKVGNEYIATRTSMALASLFEQYQPGYWVFGHHHVSMAKRINGTEFRCLRELETMQLQGSW